MVPLVLKLLVSAIEATPAHLRAVLEALHEQSKWSFTVIAGGPDPLNEGNIRTIAYVQPVLMVHSLPLLN